MSIYILLEYVEHCKRVNITPTWEGVRQCKKECDCMGINMFEKAKKRIDPKGPTQRVFCDTHKKAI